MKELQLLAGQRGGKVKAEAGSKRSKGKCVLPSSTETQKIQQSSHVFLPFSCFTILNVCPGGKSEKMTNAWMFILFLQLMDAQNL